MDRRIDYWQAGNAIRDAIAESTTISLEAGTVEQWPASAIPQAGQLLVSYPAIIISFRSADFRRENTIHNITMVFDVWVLDRGVGQGASLDLSGSYALLDAVKDALVGKQVMDQVMAPEIVSEQFAFFNFEEGLAAVSATYQIRTRRLVKL